MELTKQGMELLVALSKKVNPNKKLVEAAKKYRSVAEHFKHCQNLTDEQIRIAKLHDDMERK